MDNESTVTCSVNIEWLNKAGTVQRKVTHKTSTLRLIRSSSSGLYLEVTADKAAPIKLELKGINVHKKFMNEGKASIKFQPLNCTLYINNAPTNQLLGFLRTIFVKMTGSKPDNGANTSLRTQLLSSKPNQYSEISPVTNLELEIAKAKVAKKTDTTPSPLARKRKLSKQEGARGPAAKKLYAPSPTANELLDVEQKEVLDACTSGRNIFFTGSAGTGKSFLLKKIIGTLPPDVTFATASTGVAACHIGGITLHQFAGVGSGEATLERCKELASKPPVVTQWRRCKHLIIDEISMVDGHFFEKIEEVARHVRRNDKPFGGIQLILCGDFFQLPPVVKFVPGSAKVPPRFCFQTKAWESCRLSTFELKRVHRQSDIKFVSILNNVRIGNVDKSVTEALAATANQTIERDGILATRLCSHTKDADLINMSKLKELEGAIKLFEAQDSSPGCTQMLDHQTSVPSKLELKIGAQVMLLKNINVSVGLVNGARGVVKEFKEGLPVVTFRNKREYVAKHEKWSVKLAHGGTVQRKQVPLKLAWAFSIHKSQGLTLDCVEMSLGRVFEAGQAYVALSRAQSLETLRVLDFKPAQVWANPDVLKFYRNMDDTKLIPLKVANKQLSTKERLMKKLVKSKLFDKPLVNIS